jgi:hypothetical protein
MTCKSDDDSVYKGYGHNPIYIGTKVPGYVSMCMHRLHEQDQAIQTVVRDARIDECARAIKSACTYCRDGISMDVTAGGHRYHPHKVHCSAFELHERLATLRNP